MWSRIGRLLSIPTSVSVPYVAHAVLHSALFRRFGLLTRHEIEPYAKPCCFPLVLRGLAQVLETLRTRTSVVEGEEEVEAQMKN